MTHRPKMSKIDFKFNSCFDKLNTPVEVYKLGRSRLLQA